MYYRLKASFVRDLYWILADRGRAKARLREVQFYRNFLRGFHNGDLIFDVGANDGTKTDVFLRLDAQVITVEPDAHNRDVLESKFVRFRFKRKPVVVVGKAVSDRVSTETMWIDGPGSALNTFSRKWVDSLRGRVKTSEAGPDRMEFDQTREVETTTLEELIRLHGVPFFLKVDVEGYEVNVLRGLKRCVPYISFEVNLPEFRAEGLQCIERLSDLDGDGRFNYVAESRYEDGPALSEWRDSAEFARVLGDVKLRA